MRCESPRERNENFPHLSDRRTHFSGHTYYQNSVHSVEGCCMQYHWEIPAVLFLWDKFVYINTLVISNTKIGYLFIFSCALKHMCFYSLRMILLRHVFFIDLIQELLYDNCKFSLSVFQFSDFFLYLHYFLLYHPVSHQENRNPNSYVNRGNAS